MRIAVDVASRDAHWLRASPAFTLVRGLVGGTTIKAYSGVLTDLPLAGGAARRCCAATPRWRSRSSWPRRASCSTTCSSSAPRFGFERHQRPRCASHAAN